MMADMDEMSKPLQALMLGYRPRIALLFKDLLTEECTAHDCDGRDHVDVTRLPHDEELFPRKRLLLGGFVAKSVLQ